MVEPISSLERAVIERMAENMRDAAWRHELLSQLAAAEVVFRTDKAGGGYYLDFLCRKSPPILPEIKSPLELDFAAPDRKNRIFCHLYFDSTQLISFLEMASTGEWPVDEKLISVD